MEITRQEVESELNVMMGHLMKLAESHTWNRLSDNHLYVFYDLSISYKTSFEDFEMKRAFYKKHGPISFEEAVIKLHSMYSGLHDINLMVHKASKSVTVIEIGYYPKSALEEEYRLKTIDDPSMGHSKIEIPFWIDTFGKNWKENNEPKFDINWKHKKLLIWVMRKYSTAKYYLEKWRKKNFKR